MKKSTILVVALSIVTLSLSAVFASSTPSLVFKNAPEGASVILDGEDVGNVEEFTADNALAVADGKAHKLVVASEGKVYFLQKGFKVTEPKQVIDLENAKATPMSDEGHELSID